MLTATRSSARRKVLFTVDEANATLPLVGAIVTDLVAEFRCLRLVGRERREQGAESPSLTERVQEHSDRVEAYLRELAALGLEVRDLELGLVDFPTLERSEPAFLCWRLGEPRVATWHAADRSHAERLPLRTEAGVR